MNRYGQLRGAKRLNAHRTIESQSLRHLLAMNHMFAKAIQGELARH